MTSSSHNHLDTVATAITGLNHTLQQAPAAEEFLQRTKTDTKFINSQVGEVKTLIRELFKYRATLLRNLNLRMSPICKLPPEILGEIFKYVCRSRSKKAMAPTRVGAICSHWRQVAWSVPQLWTELIVRGKFWKSSYRAKLLDLYCKNMGGLHYSITFLKVPDESHKGSRGIPFQDVFDRLFIKHADKLKTLTFQESPNSWIPHIGSVTNSGQGLPNLESLAITDNNCENPLLNLALLLFGKSLRIAFYNVPRLRTLILEDVPPTLTFPWAQLTQLSLSNVDSEAALDIVLQCENLITLKLEDLLRSSDDVSVTLPNEPTILRNLQSLEYKSSHLSSHWERALVKCLSFTTSLKKLVWLTKDGTKELRREFLLRLPTSMTELRVDCCTERDSIQDLKGAFARLTSLRTIMLHLEDPLDLQAVELFTVTGTHYFLPSLRSIGFMMLRQEYNSQQISDILDMVRSRWAVRDKKDPFEGFTFGFPVAGKKDTKWIQDFKGEIDEIMDKEMQVQVSGKQAMQPGVWLQHN